MPSGEASGTNNWQRRLLQLHQMKAKQEQDKELFNLDANAFKGPMKIKPCRFSDQLQGYLLRECESSSASGALLTE